MPGDRRKPPPLPPRPLVAEPFPKAKSDPPPFRRALDCPSHDTRCTQSLCVLDPLHPLHWQTINRNTEGLTDRTAPTPRDGTVPIYDPDPRDGMIRELQASLVLLQQQLDEQTPMPETRPSVRARRAAVARAAAVFGVKWTLLLTLLPLVGGVVAKRWPEYSGIVDLALQLVGLR